MSTQHLQGQASRRFENLGLYHPTLQILSTHLHQCNHQTFFCTAQRQQTVFTQNTWVWIGFQILRRRKGTPTYFLLSTSMGEFLSTIYIDSSDPTFWSGPRNYTHKQFHTQYKHWAQNPMFPLPQTPPWVIWNPMSCSWSITWKRINLQQQKKKKRRKKVQHHASIRPVNYFIRINHRMQISGLKHHPRNKVYHKANLQYRIRETLSMMYCRWWDAWSTSQQH